jgi:hypothetical protein
MGRSRPPCAAAPAAKFAAARLLVATGRTPNTQRIGLEDVGVRLDGCGAVAVDAFLRTSVPHIWAAGDVIGTEQDSQMATPVGAHDGGIAAHNALSGAQLRRIDHRVIPRAVFTDPQVGVVGMADQEATAAGHTCWCNSVPLELVPRAGAILLLLRGVVTRAGAMVDPARCHRSAPVISRPRRQQDRLGLPGSAAPQVHLMVEHGDIPVRFRRALADRQVAGPAPRIRLRVGG